MGEVEVKGNGKRLLKENDIVYHKTLVFIVWPESKYEVYKHKAMREGACEIILC